MKLLKEIDPKLYESGREVPTEPGDIEDDTEVLLLARFKTLESNIAVEGLVSARGAGYTGVDFRQANQDGEPVGETYKAEIDSRGIIGRLVLHDGELVHAREGYFLRYGNLADDALTQELERLLEEDEEARLPVHFLMGGAQADLAKRELGLNRQNTDL
jgi:hypothetical protein